MFSVGTKQVSIDSIITPDLKEVTMSQTARLFTTLSIVLALAILVGCTQKERAKHGSSFTVKLECGQKLYDLTWKEDNLWYATRPMREGEEPETYYSFMEDSSYGVFEGKKVTFVECK